MQARDTTNALHSWSTQESLLKPLLLISLFLLFIFSPPFNNYFTSNFISSRTFSLFFPIFFFMLHSCREDLLITFQLLLITLFSQPSLFFIFNDYNIRKQSAKTRIQQKRVKEKTWLPTKGSKELTSDVVSKKAQIYKTNKRKPSKSSIFSSSVEF